MSDYPRLIREPDDRRVTAFLDAVRETYEAAPDPAVEKHHLAMLVAASRPIPAERRATMRRRLHAVLALAAAFLLTGVLLASLSYAGVITLPRPMRNAFHLVNINLPEPHHSKPSNTTVAPASNEGTSGSTSSGTTAQTGTGGSTSSKASADVPATPDPGTVTHRGDSSAGGSGDSPSNPGGDDECHFTAGDITKCLP